VHQEVREAFTAFSFDPHAVPARPLPNDVSDDRTPASYQTWEDDRAETHLRLRPGNLGAATSHRAAVEVPATACDAVDIHARECGDSHLTTAEQNDVRKVGCTFDLAFEPQYSGW
jgi:hypothetical protein